ncbi:hypothetical protein L9F63_012222, partial [Diploptera punctata]
IIQNADIPRYTVLFITNVNKYLIKEKIGFIDGTHIKIRNPGGEYPEIFRNSLGVFSFNCQ